MADYDFRHRVVTASAGWPDYIQKAEVSFMTEVQKELASQARRDHRLQCKIDSLGGIDFESGTVLLMVGFDQYNPEFQLISDVQHLNEKKKFSFGAKPDHVADWAATLVKGP